MPRPKIITIIILLFFGVSLTGCSLFGGGEQLKQAKAALKGGNPTQAIKITKGLLVLYPRNIRAKRMLEKIEDHLMKEAQQAWDANDYKQALSKAKLVLDKLNSENVEAQAIQRDAKKFMFLVQANIHMNQEDPVNAMKALNNALKLDPQFQEALEVKADVDKVVQEKIESFLGSAEEMMNQGQYTEVEIKAQDILAIAPQNREVAELLHKAKAAILAENREKNLGLARKFYEQGLYESSKEKAELVLKVDPNSEEAKELVENCKAELLKPGLRITGFTEIKGMIFVSIKVGDTKETLRVQEGQVFGDFKVSKIDLDMKTAVVTYLKTGSQQAITME